MFGCLSPPMYILSASQSLTISVLVMLLQRTLLKADVSLNLVQSNSPMLQLENGNNKKTSFISIAIHILFCSFLPVLLIKLMLCNVSLPYGQASCYILQFGPINTQWGTVIVAGFVDFGNSETLICSAPARQFSLFPQFFCLDWRTHSKPRFLDIGSLPC